MELELQQQGARENWLMTAGFARQPQVIISVFPPHRGHWAFHVLQAPQAWPAHVKRRGALCLPETNRGMSLGARGILRALPYRLLLPHQAKFGGTYNGLEREHAHRYLYRVPIDNIDCKMNASDEKLRDGRKDLLFSTPFIASRARRIVAARSTMPVVCIAE